MLKNKKKSVIIFIVLIILVSTCLIYYLCNNKSDTLEVMNTEENITTSDATKLEETSETTSTEITTEATTTTKSTTTEKNGKTTTKKTKTTTTTKKIVSTEEKTETTVVEEKYGSKIERTDTVKYTTYEDGTTSSKTVSKGKTKINNTNFNGTYASMKSDAASIYSSNMDKINGVLTHVNEYRAEVGVASITLDKDLSIAATVRALEMGWNNYFAHTRPDGSSCFTILSDAGISYMASGENIAYGQTSADSVSSDWKNSSGHYANMINANYTKIGIGYAKVNGKTYWVQLFVG